MIYLKEFATAQDYEAIKTNLPKPNVSLITDGSEVKYMKETPTPQSDYIDFNLPSGTKWRKMNIGASSETDFGTYYKYGYGATDYWEDTSVYTRYKGNENPLASSADTAVQVLGDGSHMPTMTQWYELLENTTYEWVEDFNGTGVSGCKFTDISDSTKYMFFPATRGYYNGEILSEGFGYYWSSTPLTSSDTFAYVLYISNGDISEDTPNRTMGCVIRPVKDAE